MTPQGEREPIEAIKRVRVAPAPSGAEPASGAEPKRAAALVGVIAAAIVGFAAFCLVLLLNDSEADMLFGDVVIFVVAVFAAVVASLVAAPIAAVVAYVVTRRRNDRRSENEPQ